VRLETFQARVLPPTGLCKLRRGCRHFGAAHASHGRLPMVLPFACFTGCARPCWLWLARAPERIQLACLRPCGVTFLLPAGCSGVTKALRPAAQLRVLSMARCGLAALEQCVHEFAAHPYLRIVTAAAPPWHGESGGDDGM
jgi:hypothetical protein